jgi:hypothetical protein
MKSKKYYSLQSLGETDANTLEAALRHRSFDSMSAILAWMLSLARTAFADFSLKGSKALEIGTGKFLNHPIGLYICGCERVVTVDKYPQLNLEAVRVAMERPVLARRYLSAHATHDDFVKRWERVVDTGFDLGRLERLGIICLENFDITQNKGFDREFDLTISYTVLEHVPEAALSDLLNATVEALNPGGFCIHFVDLEDHLDAHGAPFAFLDENLAWTELDTFHRGNRQRFSFWVRLFAQRHDLLCRFPYKAVRNDRPLPRRIHSALQFTDEQDLRTTAFLMVGRRMG